VLKQAAANYSAGGVNSARCRNPPGLFPVQTRLSRWMTSDGGPSISDEQNRVSSRSVETLAHSHCLLLSLALLRSFSPLRNARETEALRRPERRTAPPRSPWPVRALCHCGARRRRAASCVMPRWVNGHREPRGGVVSPAGLFARPGRR
jgi:hypothetical protein